MDEIIHDAMTSDQITISRKPYDVLNVLDASMTNSRIPANKSEPEKMTFYAVILPRLL